MTHYPNLTEFRERQIKENKTFLKGKLFLEFGVFKGASLLMYHSAYKDNKIKPYFFGFDAFKGLPEEKEDKYSPWHTGQFNLDGVINPELLDKEGVEIIPGWFRDTLNDETVKKFGKKKAGFVHVDCDIYSSTVEVLEFLVTNDLLADGALIVYDDWGAWKNAHLPEGSEYLIAEGRAHKEIAEKYDLDFEFVHTEVIDPAYYYITTFRYNK